MRLSILVSLLQTGVGPVFAGFNANSKSNVAIYWGQNSVGEPTSQERLSFYCDNTDVDIVILAFLLQMNGPGGQPVLNFANQGDVQKCKRFDGTDLANCPELEADIQSCQNIYGKTIFLSIGGANYNEGGFSTTDVAISSARKIWDMFGPDVRPDMLQSTSLRPFGHASVDGFDFDIEAASNNIPAFANEMRRLMDEYSRTNNEQRGRIFYLAAAPQCVFPDAYLNDVLTNVLLDMVFIQFYNNWCGVNSFVPGTDNQATYNFAAWDKWAREEAPNRSVKILMGVPGGQSAAGGYVTADQLGPVVEYSSKFNSFGGTMVWDASQAWKNAGFLGHIKGALPKNKGGMRWGVRHE